LHRLDQPEPCFRARDVGLVDDAMVAIEAMERTGEL